MLQEEQDGREKLEDTTSTGGFRADDCGGTNGVRKRRQRPNRNNGLTCSYVGAPGAWNSDFEKKMALKLEKKRIKKAASSRSLLSEALDDERSEETPSLNATDEEMSNAATDDLPAENVPSPPRDAEEHGAAAEMSNAATDDLHAENVPSPPRDAEEHGAAAALPIPSYPTQEQRDVVPTEPPVSLSKHLNDGNDASIQSISSKVCSTVESTLYSSEDSRLSAKIISDSSQNPPAKTESSADQEKEVGNDETSDVVTPFQSIASNGRGKRLPYENRDPGHDNCTTLYTEPSATTVSTSVSQLLPPNLSHVNAPLHESDPTAAPLTRFDEQGIETGSCTPLEYVVGNTQPVMSALGTRLTASTKSTEFRIGAVHALSNPEYKSPLAFDNPSQYSDVSTIVDPSKMVPRFGRWSSVTGRVTIDSPSYDLDIDSQQWGTFTPSLAESLLSANLDLFALRVWLLDNSATMNKDDAQRLAPYDEKCSTSKKRFVTCTRWEELTHTVDAHCELAAVVRSPIVFRFANDPVVGTQQFSVAEKTFETLHREVRYAKNVMRHVEPSGNSNLLEHLAELHSSIKTMSPRLIAEGKLVGLVIATDNIPSHSNTSEQKKLRRRYRDALLMYCGLPVWIVIRLSCDDPKVEKFYRKISQIMALENDGNVNMTILKNYHSEAKDVNMHNQWVNYAYPIHVCRESMVNFDEFDFLSIRPLRRYEVHSMCRTMFLELSLEATDDTEEGWRAFRKDLKLATKEGLVWNPSNRKVMSWIMFRYLDRMYTTDVSSVKISGSGNAIRSMMVALRR